MRKTEIRLKGLIKDCGQDNTCKVTFSSSQTSYVYVITKFHLIILTKIIDLSLGQLFIIYN